MIGLSDRDRNLVSASIRQIEAQTSGEIVTVIAEASDNYYYIPLLWAALVAFFVPIVAWFGGLSSNVLQVSLAQLAVFGILALLARWRPLRYRLIPKGLMKARAARLAREQFFARGVRETVNRTGILIFVSLAERHVEVLADSGINRKVDPRVWRKAVSLFVENIKAGKIAEGLLAAIAECGGVLIEHFPDNKENPDELPNHLIEI